MTEILNTKEILNTDTHSITVLDDFSEDDTLSIEKMKLLDKLSKIRSKVETGGVYFNDIIIKTDEGSLGKITSTIMALQSGMMTSIDWKGENGWIRDVDLDTMMGIAMVVSAHVQKSFTTENKISEIIENMLHEDIINVDLDIMWDSYFTSQ